MAAVYKRALRSILGAFAALVLFVVGALVALHTAAGHRYVLSVITDRIQQAINSPVEIQNFAFHWSGLAIDLYGVTVLGASSGFPLATIDRLDAHIGLGFFQKQKVQLRSVIVDHPVIHLVVNARGQTNLPARTQSQTHKNIFDMAVGHAALNRGEIYYNDRFTPLDAEIHNLEVRLNFRSSTSAYETSLQYSDARLQFGNIQPFTHDLAAMLNIAPGGATVESLRLNSGPSFIQAKGQLRNYAHPFVEASYRASVSTGELAGLLHESGTISGQLNTSGTVKYQKNSHGPFIKGISIAGAFDSSALAFETPAATASVRSLAGKYTLENGSADVSAVEAGVWGGHLYGELRASHLEDVPVANLDAKVTNVSLADARASMRQQPISGVALNGSVNGSVLASWRGAMRDLQLRSDLNATGSVASQSSGTKPAPIPISAIVHVAYDSQTQVLTLRDTAVRAPATSVLLNGRLGDAAQLAIHAQSDDLREVDRLALIFRTVPVSRGKAAPVPAQAFELQGAASFSGNVTGRLANPQLAGYLMSSGTQIHGVRLNSIQTTIQLSSSEAALHNGELQLADNGRASFDISTGLRDWSFASDVPIRARVTADQLSIREMQQMAGLQYPLEGILSGSLSVTGTEQNPAGQGTVQIAQARAWNEPIQAVSINFQGAGDEVRATAQVRAQAGVANANINYSPRSQRYELQVNVPGIRLEQLQHVREGNREITGVLVVTANGRGTLSDPQLDASIEATHLRVGDQVLDGLKAETQVANQRAEFNFSGNVSGAALEAKGNVKLKGDYQATAEIKSQPVEIGPLLAGLAPQFGAALRGETQFQGTLSGPLKEPRKITAQFAMNQLSVAYQTVQLAAASPIRISYREGTLALEHSELKGSGTDLQFQGTLAIAPLGALQASATGNADLKLIELFSPDWQGSGSAQINMRAQGPVAHPDLDGTISVQNANLTTSTAPGLSDVNGVLQFASGRLTVQQLSGKVGGGDFTMGGFASFTPTTQFNISMNARGVRLLYPRGIRVLLNGNLNLAGTPSSSQLIGNVAVNNLSVTKDFDVSTLAAQFSAPPSPSTGMAENIRLNIGVSSMEQLGVSTSQLSIQGTADLRVEGTAADPVIVGRATLTGGELFFNGRRFELQSGAIQFVNPVQTEPVVNLTVNTTIQQFDLTVNMVGPLDRMRTTYTSDPPLPPVDVIHLIITGQTVEAGQATTTSPESLLASQLSGQVSGRLQKFTGISSLTIDPQIGGNQGNAASQLAIQERVTKNLLFTFATDVTTTQGQVIELQYQFSRRFALSATRDQTGGYQVQIKSHKNF